MAKKPKNDQDSILGKNSLAKGLIRLTQKFAKIVTETNSKVREPKTYNEAINHPINDNRWHKVVNEEL